MDAELQNISNARRARAYQKWITSALVTKGFFVKHYTDTHLKWYTEQVYPHDIVRELETERRNLRTELDTLPDDRNMKTRKRSLQRKIDKLGREIEAARARLQERGQGRGRGRGRGRVQQQVYTEANFPVSKNFSYYDHLLFSQILRDADQNHVCVRKAILPGFEHDILLNPNDDDSVKGFVVNNAYHRLQYTQRRMIICFKLGEAPQEGGNPTVDVIGFSCYAVPLMQRQMQFRHIKQVLGFLEPGHALLQQVNLQDDQYMIGKIDIHGNLQEELFEALQTKSVYELRYICSKAGTHIGKFLIYLMLLEMASRQKKMKYAVLEPAYSLMYERYPNATASQKAKYQFEAGIDEKYKVMYSAGLFDYYQGLGFDETTNVHFVPNGYEHLVDMPLVYNSYSEGLKIEPELEGQELPIPVRWMVRKLDEENPLDVFRAQDKREIQKILGDRFHKLCKFHPAFKNASACM